MVQLTQRDRAHYQAQAIRQLAVGLAARLVMLDTVLDQAQNAPPNGESDGSIEEAEFNALRGAVHKFQEALWAIEVCAGDALKCGLCRRSFFPANSMSCRTMCPECLGREK
jgi:hypothetical protein